MLSYVKWKHMCMCFHFTHDNTSRLDARVRKVREATLSSFIYNVLSLTHKISAIWLVGKKTKLAVLYTWSQFVLSDKKKNNIELLWREYIEI